MVDFTKIFSKLSGTSQDEFYQGLDEFVTNPTSRLTFTELNDNDLRAKIWRMLYGYLEKPEHSPIHDKCFTALRILSRDTTDLESLITEERFNVAVKNANLAKNQNLTPEPTINIIIEALKFICNLLYNCSKVRTKVIMKTTCIPAVIERIYKYDNDTPHNMKIYDIRILFLTTAFNVPSRRYIRTELHGDVVFIEMLEKISKNESINDDDADLISESSKVVFNLFLNMENSTDNELTQYKKLVGILRELLVRKYKNKQQEVCCNIAKLLIVFPNECYSAIIIPATENKECVYNNLDMRAVAKLLDYLNTVLDIPTDLEDNICPIVTALTKIVKCERYVRKYIRLQILPPLKDVMNRPEEGTTTRAKLCTLLTTPLTTLRDIVAEFLFILCKENVGRMIKYTGYGNAAGMFANKGLLGKSQKIDYSSDSENSDTEEYRKYKESINPVTGCCEGPKTDPLAGMTEEQKEYEALKLVEHIDRLTRQGVVQPCRVGPDGKPVPIEHVLELQAELQKQQIKQDSDSD